VKLQCQKVNIAVILFGDREKPDVVFFQELVPETFSYIEDKLPEYMCIAGNTVGYFTATLLRKFTVYYDSHKIIEHADSLMMRNLLTVEVMTTDVICHSLCT
jgi:hypothetical protein